MGDSKASGDGKKPSSRDEGSSAQPNRAETERHPDADLPSAPRNDGIQGHQNGDNHGDESQDKWRRYFGEIKFAEWCMIVFTAITAMATWAGVVIADHQWKLGKRQIKLAEQQFAWAREQQKSADLNTQKALNIAQTTAKANADQAAATKQMAAATNRTATATTQQLAIIQAIDLDTDLKINPWSKGAAFAGLGIIRNRGSSTIHATVTVNYNFFQGSEPKDWRQFNRPVLKTDIIPNVDHWVGAMTLPVLNDAGWQAFADRKIGVFFAYRMVFKEATGKKVVKDKCVYATGLYVGEPAYECP